MSVTVKAEDASGAVVSSYSGRAHFSSSDAQAVLPPDSTLTGGAGSFSVTIETAGAQMITTTDAANSSIHGTSGSVDVRFAVPLITPPLSPTVTAPGGTDFTLTVNGFGFSNASVIQWNGSALPTTLVNHGQLTATVPSSAIAVANTATVAVVNPSPGGGTSNAVFFGVTNPVKPVNLSITSSPTTDSGSYSLAAGDFNADGKLDIVATNIGISGSPGGNDVSVLLGHGDGTFENAVNYPVGNTPSWVVVGDFNGDHKLDLAVVNAGDNNVSILLGNGDGTFQGAVNFDVGQQPDCVVVGDFDGDGRLDLAVANAAPRASDGTTSVSVLLGNGDGTFQAHVDYTVVGDSSSIAVGDFNADGKLDLVVNGNTTIFFGNGDGTLQSGGAFGQSNGAFSLAVADVNADSVPDLLVGSVLTAGSFVYVWRGIGDGSLVPVGPDSVGPNDTAHTAVVGDFDGDGKVDVVAAGLGTNPSNNISLLLGNGDYTFQLPLTFGIGANFSAVPGDFNNDGKLDLATGSRFDSRILILLQQ
jgi:VCBS repeat protein